MKYKHAHNYTNKKPHTNTTTHNLACIFLNKLYLKIHFNNDKQWLPAWSPPPLKKTQKKTPKQNKEVRKRKISCYPKS